MGKTKRRLPKQADRSSRPKQKSQSTLYGTGTKVKQQQKLVQRTTKWVYNGLLSSEKSIKNCYVPFADVVIFGEKNDNKEDGSGSKWLYTNDEGKLETHSALNWSRIKERFLKLSFQTNNNTNGNVCKVYYVDGSEETLDLQSFKSLLVEIEKGEVLGSISMLQAIVNRPEQNGNLRCQSTYKQSTGTSTHCTEGDPGTVDLAQIMDGVTREVVDVIESGRKVKVFSLAVNYAADSEGNMRVTNIRDIVTSAAKKQSSKKKNINANTTNRPKSVLPNLRPSSQSSEKKEGKKDHSKIIKCKGDFCGLVVDSSQKSLGVLSLDTPMASNSTHNSSGGKDWKKQLDRVRSGIKKGLGLEQQERADTEVEQREENQSMHTIGNKQLLLARSEMQFITGAIRHTDASLCDDLDFGKAWLQLDNKMNYELGMKHPTQFYQECQVCNDCYKIYTRIDQLRQQSFCVDSTTFQRPASEEENNHIPSTYLQSRSDVSSAPQNGKRSQNQVNSTTATGDILNGFENCDVTVEEEEGSSENDEEESTEIYNSTETSGYSKKKSKKNAKKNSASTPVLSSHSTWILEQTKKQTNGKSTKEKSKTKQVKKVIKSKEIKHKQIAEQNIKAEKRTTDTLQTSAESQFLIRQAEQLKDQIRQHEIERQVAPSISQEEYEQYQENHQKEIKEYENSVVQMSAQIQNNRTIISELEAELKKAKNGLANSQKDFLQVMKEKDEECKRLELEVEHTKNALLSSSQGGSFIESNSQVQKLEKTKKNLLSTIEDLNSRLSVLENANMKLHKQLEEKKMEQSAAMEEDYKRRLSAERSKVENLQEKMDDLQTQLRELRKETSISKNKESELRRQISLLTEDKEKTLSSLSAAKQSLAAMSKLQGTENVNSHGSEPSFKATSDAKVMQLKNELDYVRSQLASEVKCKEELSITISQIHEEIGKAKREGKEMLRSLESEKNREMQEREIEFQNEIQAPKAEVKLLEEKVKALQRSLNDITQDLGTSRRKIEHLQKENRNLEEQQKKLKVDNTSLKRNVEELQETLNDQGINKNSSTGKADADANIQAVTNALRSTTDAAIRRLESEVQYWKNQLKVETDLKMELSSALAQSKEKLTKAMQDWKSENSSYEEKLRYLSNDMSVKESALREDIIRADGERESLEEQLEELRKLYSQAKDQIRIDRTSLEEAMSIIPRLKNEVKAARDEAERERTASKSNAEAHQVSLSALQKTIRDIEASNHEDKEILKKRLREAHQKIGQTTSSMLDLRDDMSASSSESRKMLATSQFINIIRSKCSSRMHRSFYILKSENKLLQISEGLKKQAENELEQHSQLSKQRENIALKEISQNAEIELEETVRSLKSQHFVRVENIEKMAHEDQISTIRRAQLKMKMLIEEKLKDSNVMHEAALAAEEQNSQLKMHKLQAAHRAEKQALLRQAENEKLAALESFANEAEENLNNKLKNLTNSYEEQLVSVREAASERLQKVIESAKRDKDQSMRTFMETAQRDTHSALLELGREKAQEIENLRKTLKDEMEQKIKEKETAANDKLKEEIDLQEEKHKQELESAINEIKSTMEKKLLDAKTESDTKFKDEFEKLKKEHSEQLKSLKTANAQELEEQERLSEKKLEEALDKLRKEELETRTAAMQRNTAKWQNLLQECTNDALLEKEKLMMKSEEEKRDALAELKKVMTKQQSDRDKAAIQAQNKALEEAEQRTSEKLKQLREQMELKAKTKLDETVKEIQLKNEGALIRAEADHQRELKRLRIELERETKLKLEELASEREDALAACAREAALQMAEEIKRVQNTERDTSKKMLEELTEKHETNERELLEECDKITEHKLKQAQKKLEKAISECNTKHEKIKLEESLKFEKEREQLMNDAQTALETEQEQTRKAQNEAARSKQLLEESEDMTYDLQQNVAKLLRAGAVYRLKHQLGKMKAFSTYCKLKEKSQNETQNELDKLKRKYEKINAKMERQLVKKDKALQRLEETQNVMRDVLVNYKRDTLMQHKARTTVIHGDLTKLSDAKLKAEKERNIIVSEIAQIEGQIKELERQLRELGKVSAIQNGRVNVTHAKKKRRLDQEFEHVLEKTEMKREKLADVEESIQIVDKNVEDNEQELKKLEAQLVEILVEQQKKLLGVLVLKTEISV